MDALTISAASGMRARLEALELLANNIANAATAGYKSDREFYNLYVATESVAGAGPPSTLPVVERNWTDFSPGALTATGNPTDLALEGRGFFVVNGPSGSLYTRSGSFRISPSGEVRTIEGFAVRAAGGGVLRIDPARSFEVSREGGVFQNGQEAGRLELVDFNAAEALAKQAGAYFRLADPKLAPSPARPEVHQGQLEAANFSPAEAAIRLVGVMRQFETLQRAISLAGEMNRRAVEEVARV